MIDVRAYVQSLNARPVAVYGLGLSNRAAISALLSAGAEVHIGDDHEAACNAPDYKDMPRIDEGAMDQYGGLVLSPGVPFTHPEPHSIVKKAQAAHVEILCDIELFYRSQPDCKIIAITGTNGKSTTTALTAHIIGDRAVAAGNIGLPVLSIDAARCDVAVLEVSSYQLDLCHEFAPDIAILLNITPDHLDRHGTMDNYAQSKARIFTRAQYAIIGDDDKYCRDIFDKALGEKQKIKPEKRDSLDIKSLRGDHNLQNMAASYAACMHYGLKEEDILRGIKSFPGLAHRQYLVAEHRGVQFINDSKATNAEAASKALSSFENIHWIVGGVAKEGGLNGLDIYKERVKKTYVIGTAPDIFSDWLTQNSFENIYTREMEKAVRMAYDNAQESDVILLSPAAASFDQYQNFEKRGDDFENAVKSVIISVEDA